MSYMLRVMRDPAVESTRRDAMAKAAAPYLHAALASTQVRHANADGSPVGPQLTQVFLDTTGKPVERVDMTQTTAPEDKGELN
jgi:hypothetical protein